MSSEEQYANALVDSMAEGRVFLIAHSLTGTFSSDSSEIKINASFVFLAEDYTLRQIPLEDAVGHVSMATVSPNAVVIFPQTTQAYCCLLQEKQQ